MSANSKGDRPISTGWFTVRRHIPDGALRTILRLPAVRRRDLSAGRHGLDVVETVVDGIVQRTKVLEGYGQCVLDGDTTDRRSEEGCRTRGAERAVISRGT
jgi:hypothetical protein